MNLPPRPAAAVSLLAVSIALAAAPGPAADAPARVAPEREWRAHGGDPGHTQHSPLAQIHGGNVKQVKVAWTYDAGDARADAGGLVFIGATKDERFRAFDRGTGRMLWEAPLPAGGYATPATYEAGGRQYVVIAAGGGKMGTKSAGTYVAFALPD